MAETRHNLTRPVGNDPLAPRASQATGPLSLLGSATQGGTTDRSAGVAAAGGAAEVARAQHVCTVFYLLTTLYRLLVGDLSLSKAATSASPLPIWRSADGSVAPLHRDLRCTTRGQCSRAGRVHAAPGLSRGPPRDSPAH